MKDHLWHAPEAPAPNRVRNKSHQAGMIAGAVLLAVMVATLVALLGALVFWIWGLVL